MSFIYYIPSPFKITGRLTFFTQILMTRLIKKLYENIKKFKPFLKIINKVSHSKNIFFFQFF